MMYGICMAFDLNLELPIFILRKARSLRSPCPNVGHAPYHSKEKRRLKAYRLRYDCWAGINENYTTFFESGLCTYLDHSSAILGHMDTDFS